MVQDKWAKFGCRIGQVGLSLVAELTGTWESLDRSGIESQLLTDAKVVVQEITVAVYPNTNFR